jgi:hypothetical protein
LQRRLVYRSLQRSPLHLDLQPGIEFALRDFGSYGFLRRGRLGAGMLGQIAVALLPQPFDAPLLVCPRGGY